MDPSDKQVLVTRSAGARARRAGGLLRDANSRASLALVFSLLVLVTCIGCQQASGEQSTGEPKSERDARAEARAGDAVARAGGGAEARAGEVVAIAEGGKARAESRAESRIEGSGGSPNIREATLQIEGAPGTEFSGTCMIGDEERQIRGQVPERFVFELDGRKLECEIGKQGAGAMNIVLDAGGADYVQRTASPRATVRIVYSAEGFSSSIESSIGSSRQTITNDSSSIVSSKVSRSTR